MDVTKETLKDCLLSLDQVFTQELLAKSEAELVASYDHCFYWDQQADAETNLYNFTTMLELYKHQCERWEKHHNGICCIVERVRDKYVMPRIRAFLPELVKHCNVSRGI